jgi:adenylate cyclase
MRVFLTVVFGGLSGALLLIVLRIAKIFPILDPLFFQSLGKSTQSTVVSPDGSLLLGLLLCFLAAWVAVDVRRTAQRWLLGVLAISLLGTSSLVCALYNIIFSPLAPMTGVLAGLAFTSLFASIGPGAFRRKVDDAFGNAIGRKFLRGLYDAPTSLLSQPTRANASVLVLQIGNVSANADADPQIVAEMNHEYLTLASDFLAEAGALIDSCSGLSLRAVFGVPVKMDLPAIVAAKAAIDLLQRLERMNLEADSKWHRILDFHLGLATGEVVAGVFGCPRGRPYTVTGHTVDLAERLAKACGRYGCRSLVCMETFRCIYESFDLRPIDLVSVNGAGEVEIYELLAAKGALSPERKRSRDHFWTGVTNFRSGRLDEAIAEFSSARITGIPDGPLDYYLRRIEREKKGAAWHLIPSEI